MKFKPGDLAIFKLAPPNHAVWFRVKIVNSCDDKHVTFAHKAFMMPPLYQVDNYLLVTDIFRDEDA